MKWSHWDSLWGGAIITTLIIKILMLGFLPHKQNLVLPVNLAMLSFFLILLGIQVLVLALRAAYYAGRRSK